MPETEVVGGPVTAQLGQRSPFGAMERLDHEALVAAQQESLASPRRKYSLSARLLFSIMDRLYGAERTLPKFRVLELVARVPYQAWENVAYVTVTHTSRQPDLARRVFDVVRLARWEQDNEQWHLLILEELTAADRQPFLRHRVVPQILAFAYYQLSWAMYVVRPAWSYRLNADFEDHAEHEYAALVEENRTGRRRCSTAVRGRLRTSRLPGRPVPSDRLRRAAAQAGVRGPHGAGPLSLTAFTAIGRTRASIGKEWRARGAPPSGS